MTSTIIPVILCGGSGTRLWPTSRKSYPKQFTKLFNNKTLFQNTLERVSGDGFADPILVTTAEFRFIAAEQASMIGIEPSHIILEPEAKNTAPAILAAALVARDIAADALLLILPSDHKIDDEGAFLSSVHRGHEPTQNDHIVTFGVTPTHAETGYGWLSCNGVCDGINTLPLSGFVEKPDAKTAQAMLEAGAYYWNSGIFMARARTWLGAFQSHAPDMLQNVEASVKHAQQDLDFLRLTKEPWSRIIANSVDYEIMERSVDNTQVVPLDAGWSDLGDWRSVWQQSEKDVNGVASFGQAHAMNCKNSFLRAENTGQVVVGIGLENIAVIAMNDAVLVTQLDDAQSVRQAVADLKAAKSPQSEGFLIDHRPWGSFETLAYEGRFQVKRIRVHPGASLSLQSHMHRSEHWIVVSGTAHVTINDHTQMVYENQSAYIPIGAKHRLENPGKLPLILIEVQTGEYLGEDDIVRFDDIYRRTETG